MLRMMMYDFARADDSRFIAMMQDFVRTYSGKGASTADFKAVCDKHFGGDMGWFFDQWVYGTAIPKITIEYSITDGPQGPVFLVDSKQQNVPEGFRSMIPVVLRTKTGGMSARIVLSKATLHNELKLREKPESVEFNPYYSLLCDLEVKKR
jgi:aminopeptidase N